MLYRIFRWFNLVVLSLIKKVISRFTKKDNQYIHQWILSDQFLSNVSKPIVIEIGAHIGNDTKFFIDNYTGSRVIAFEPDPRNYEVLSKRFDTEDRVTLFNYALSEKNGVTQFFKSIQREASKDLIKKNINVKEFGFDPVNYMGSASSSLLFPSHLEGDCINVETRRLDDFCKYIKREQIFLTWVDVQGAEKMVIDGGRNLLNKSKFIWIEYGEVEYPGALTREETIDCFQSTHRVVSFISNRASKGNLLLKMI
jgi:2-O-methyltransferase